VRREPEGEGGGGGGGLGVGFLSGALTDESSVSDAARGTGVSAAMGSAAPATNVATPMAAALEKSRVNM
jgi:hypothetical protein